MLNWLRIYRDDDKGGAGSGETKPEEKPEAKSEEKGGDEKKYSDKDLNDIIKGKSSEAQTKILKELGVEDIAAAKSRLAKLKELEDKDKTDSEKTAEALKAKEAEAAASKREAEEARGAIEAIKLGVPAERAEKFVKIALTYDGATVADKMKAALEDLPEFKGEGKPSLPNLNTKTGGKAGNAKDEALALARESMGIRKEKKA
jgi:hypothetical protein